MGSHLSYPAPGTIVGERLPARVSLWMPSFSDRGQSAAVCGTDAGAGGKRPVTQRLVHFYWTASTMSYEARCPECKQLCGMVTAEAVHIGEMKVPLFIGHECPVEREVNGL